MLENDNNHAGQDGHHHAPEAQSGPSTHESQEPQLPEGDAHNPKMIQDLHIAACFDRVVGMEDMASPLAARRYVEQLLAESKKTDDPVEVMMIQQLILAHHRVANLHVSAATAEKVDTREKYSAMAQRLLAEFRRLALALREYRSPATGRQSTVVHRIDRVDQLNHAEATQDISYAKAAGPGGGVSMTCSDTELGTNASPKDFNHGHNRFQFDEEDDRQPCPDQGQQAQPIQA